jgi:ribose/xylose/arabinose/galactoside ABC-type transport system permease subunit
VTTSTWAQLMGMPPRGAALAEVDDRNPPLLLFVVVLGLAAGLAMVLGHNIWLGGALPIVITLLGWLIAIRGAVLLSVSQDTTIKFFEALRYEELFYGYMGATLVLGLFLTFASFSA